MRPASLRSRRRRVSRACVRGADVRWPTVTTKRTRTQSGRPPPRHQCHPQARAGRGLRPRPRSFRVRRRRAAGRKSHLAAGPRHAGERRHRHRLVRHAGDLLAHQPAPLRRGPHQPLLRGLARDALSVAGGADALSSEERIDDDGLKRIIDDAYQAAGLDPAKIDTGAVILTGEALRRENAEGIAKLLSEQGGDFVCATAGHHMELMLAAYGSGASKASHEGGKRILNIDIGGGTTKLADRREGLRDRDRGGAYRRPPAGGRREGQHRAARSGRALSRAAGRLRLAQGRRDRSEAARHRRRDHGRRAGRRADAAADAARGRAPLSHRRDPRFRQDRRHAVLRRRRRIRLRPREPRLRRHGPPARAGDPPPRRRRQDSVAAAAGGRMHPRHRAGRVGIQRPALRQHQLHLQAGRAAAAPEPAGAAAAVRMRRDDRRRQAREGDQRPLHRRST